MTSLTEYKNLINSLVANANKQNKTNFNASASIAFNSGELFTAIHNTEYTVMGEKVNGKWLIKASFRDLFDFDYHDVNYYGPKGKEWLANNMAAISQNQGAIVPFWATYTVDDTR